jgi:hypothetical protein
MGYQFITQSRKEGTVKEKKDTAWTFDVVPTAAGVGKEKSEGKDGSIKESLSSLLKAHKPRYMQMFQEQLAQGLLNLMEEQERDGSGNEGEGLGDNSGATDSH